MILVRYLTFQRWNLLKQHLKIQRRCLITDPKNTFETQLEDRKLPKYSPGKRLTNDEILSLFLSFHESKGGDKIESDLKHLLTVFGFERIEFIEGCKQIAKVIGDAVSSPRFRTHTLGYIFDLSDNSDTT